MPHGHTRLAPEPDFSAYNHLIYEVALFLRSRPQLSGDQAFDLGDAIHNVPAFLIRHGAWDDATFRRLYLEPYDRKWAKSDGDFSLIRALDAGFAHSRGGPSVQQAPPMHASVPVGELLPSREPLGAGPAADRPHVTWSGQPPLDTVSNPAKPATLVGIALAAVGVGGVLGALTNAVNGAVSPAYFRNILRWHHVEDVWRAAVAQGIFEGLIYGVIFSTVFTLVVGLVSRARTTFGFAFKHLLLAGGIALGAWSLGGVVAMGLAALSPDFYRSTFIGVPSDFGEMLKYAWVGGSIWGVLFGAVLSVVIASITAAAEWRRRARPTV
jgi:hypothetical protein